MKKTNLIVQKVQTNTRAFSTRKHPVFGRGIVYEESRPPKTVIQSPFYWWFKFLQLNEEYRAAFDGKKSKIPNDLVQDFGDVFNTDFKSWWIKHVELFSEPPWQYKMKIATNPEEMAPFGDENVINLVVPLNWTNVGIKRSFARIIDKLVPKETRNKKNDGAPKQKRTIITDAEYRLGSKWSITGFQNSYNIYLIKKKYDQLHQAGSKKVALADIAIEANLKIYERYKEGKTIYDEQQIRKILTIMAKRHIDKANGYIKAAASKSFPK